MEIESWSPESYKQVIIQLTTRSPVGEERISESAANINLQCCWKHWIVVKLTTRLDQTGKKLNELSNLQEYIERSMYIQNQLFFTIWNTKHFIVKVC